MKARILFLIDTLVTVGGTERHVFEMAKRLQANGQYEPLVYSLGPEGPFSLSMKQAGLKVGSLDIGKVYGAKGRGAFKYLKSIIYKENIGLVHAFHFSSQLLGSALSKATGRPLIVSARDLGFWEKPHHRIIKRFLNPFARYFLGNSRAVAEDLAKRGIPAQKIRVIYNGVDIQKFSFSEGERQAFRKEYSLDQVVPVIAYLGWLRPEKGVDIFIRAAAKLVQEKKRATFWVIGDGPQRSALEQKARDLGISSQVRFWGDRQDIPQLLSCVDICVLPSNTEGFSNTALEAMAVGVPVIASRVGGNPEAVKDGETGLLVAPGDVDALAIATGRLLEDEPLRKKMGQNAQQRARAEFDIAQTVRQYEQLYDEAIARGK